jgi:hypothetical protein
MYDRAHRQYTSHSYEGFHPKELVVLFILVLRKLEEIMAIFDLLVLREKNFTSKQT